MVSLLLFFRVIFKVGTPGASDIKSFHYDQNWLDKLNSYDIIIDGITKNVNITYDNQGNPLTITNFKYNGLYYDTAYLDWEGRQLRKLELTDNLYDFVTIKYLYNDQGYRINKTIIEGLNEQSIDYLLSNGKVIHETDGTYLIIYTYDYDGSLISFNYDNNINDSING